MIIDLYEKNKIVIPKTLTIQEEGVLIKNLDLSKNEESRKIRYSDSKKFF